MKGLSIEFPVTMDILVRDLSLKLGDFSFCHFNAVQGPDKLNVTLCRTNTKTSVCMNERKDTASLKC